VTDIVVQSGFLTQMETIVQDVVSNRNFDAGFQAINDLHEKGREFDDAIGMILNGMNDIWNPAEHDGERFEQAALRMTGLKPVTVQRHLKIQKALPSIPEPYRDEIREMGVKSKIRVAQLVEGGYEVTDNDWLRLATAVDEKEVDRISRDIRGVEPRTNWLSISIDNNGILRVHTVRAVQEIGRLETWNDNEDVQKAISRLLGCTGVQPSTEY
jgi:hypothetical protein